MKLLFLMIPLIHGIWVWGCKDILVVNLLNLTEHESGGFMWMYWNSTCSHISLCIDSIYSTSSLAYVLYILVKATTVANY